MVRCGSRGLARFRLVGYPRGAMPNIPDNLPPPESAPVGPSGRRVSWTARDRFKALAVYAETQSIDNASRHTGVPATTIHGWTREPDAADFMQQVRLALRAECAWSYAEMAMKCLADMEDRRVNGEDHVLRDGTIVRKRVSYKDLLMGASICTDKHALLTGSIAGRDASKAVGALATELLAALRQHSDTSPTPPAPSGNSYVE